MIDDGWWMIDDGWWMMEGGFYILLVSSYCRLLLLEVDLCLKINWLFLRGGVFWKANFQNSFTSEL